MGLFSCLALVGERLALADIVQGVEPDLGLEWAVVHLALVPFALFHVLGLASAVMTVQLLRRRQI
jgi:hypothetical protein